LLDYRSDVSSRPQACVSTFRLVALLCKNKLGLTFLISQDAGPFGNASKFKFLETTQIASTKELYTLK
jgi:hypothetical protein